MRIVVDENMLGTELLFAPYAEVIHGSGRHLKPEVLRDVDALLVRSVTSVNAQLLSQANRLTFVGSATIGTDHVDQAYLKQLGIDFAYAPGCNATAVGEYVLMALLTLAVSSNTALTTRTFGIIGAGHTGQAVAQRLVALGLQVYVCDPWVHVTDPALMQVSLPQLIQACDVITLHVPLTTEGVYSTHHLFDTALFESLLPNTWLINCARGAVVQTAAALAWQSKNPEAKLVCDVWENEPTPSLDLLTATAIATPHIAGYSVEGKLRGTWQLYQALAAKQGWPAVTLNELLHQAQIAIQDTVTVSPVLNTADLLSVCNRVYNLSKQDCLFREMIKQMDGFDTMRQQHRYRRELSAIRILSEQAETVRFMSQLGFSN
jgi:erythronate-4-phosphate dehydrogenase